MIFFSFLFSRFHTTYRWCTQGGRIRCHLVVPLSSDKWKILITRSASAGRSIPLLLGQQGKPLPPGKYKTISQMIFFHFILDCHSLSYIRFLACYASCTSSHTSRRKTNFSRRLWASNRKRSQRQTVRDLERNRVSPWMIIIFNYNRM